MSKLPMGNHSTERYKIPAIVPVYLPWFLSVSLQLLPEASYLVAWLGSFFIFYFTVRFHGETFDLDLPRIQQIMRPIVLIQFVFAGFMCCTSIFYFVDYLGYFSFEHHTSRAEPQEDQISRIAQCQRLGLLAHSALVTGMFWVRRQTNRHEYSIMVPLQRFLVVLSISSLLLSLVLTSFSGTKQLAILLSTLSLFSGTMLLVRSIRVKNLGGSALGACIFLFSVSNHLFTGYKEAIIVHLILLTCLTFPLYPKTVAVILIPIIMAILILLPTFTKHIRQQAWTEHRKHSNVRHVASLTPFVQQPDELMNNNWEFLSRRFSEIGMFTQFVKKVPEERPYYGMEILYNALKALIPRILWPSKPDTEKIAMKRVYELAVVSPASSVSAKSRPVVDGYLSGGSMGVFLTMFIYGYLSQSICNTSIRWFGGDQIGCLVFFNGLFQQLWRGNNLEFLLNNIVYGLLLMTLIFYSLRICRIILPNSVKN